MIYRQCYVCGMETPPQDAHYEHKLLCPKCARIFRIARLICKPLAILAAMRSAHTGADPEVVGWDR